MIARTRIGNSSQSSVLPTASSKQGTSLEPARIEEETVFSRVDALHRLSTKERPVLAFVSYDSDVFHHKEWVYNHSDLEKQQVILAHDLGEEHNKLLIAQYPERAVWKIHVSTDRATLVECSECGLQSADP
jgi:hypothetical protein